MWVVTNVPPSEDSKAALNKLCIVLDDTSVLLKRLTDQTEAQESRLHSLSPPDDTKTLESVQAVLRHNFAPPTTTNLVKSLRDMGSEIRACLRKLETAFQHTWRLYGAMSNGPARAPTNGSTLSTSTTLTARINLVDWLKNRQGTWEISRQKKGAITVSVIVVIWPHESRSVTCLQSESRRDLSYHDDSLSRCCSCHYVTGSSFLCTAGATHERAQCSTSRSPGIYNPRY